MTLGIEAVSQVRQLCALDIRVCCKGILTIADVMLKLELVHPRLEMHGPTSREAQATAERITRTGVPRIVLGGRFYAAEALSLISSPAGTFVRFGTGLGTPVCLDPRTLAVVGIKRPRGNVIFMNSSLEKFVTVARSVTQRFPFHSIEDEWEAIELAAKSVADVIRDIEPAAMKRDLFWSVLVDDIGMGDFATELLLSDEPDQPGRSK